MKKDLKVSLIVSVYKDYEALDILFETLLKQTYKNFEVIVAEDDNNIQIKKVIDKFSNKLEIQHIFHEDLGVRKSKIQNDAIRVSSGTYLIFIDGDIIPYSNFIENHVLLSNKNTILAGRRVNLGPKYSKMIRDRVLSPYKLEKNFIKYFFDLQKDAKEEKHSEEGFYIKPNSLLHKILKKRAKKTTLLGCNMSMYKEVMLKINGFDEDLLNSSFASDTDLQWRFEGLGYEIKSIRFIANQFHLYHKRSVSHYDRKNNDMMQDNINNKRYVCKNGVVKL